MITASRYLTPIFIAAALALRGFAQPPVSSGELTKEKKAQIIAKLNTVVTQYAYVPGADFSKVPELLKKAEPDLASAKTEDEFANQVNVTLATLGYSHIVMFSPKAAYSFFNRKTVGVGIRIEVVPEGVRIVDVIEKAPAGEAGLKAGDIIVEANGQKPEGPAQIAGEAGTVVKLKVKRGAQLLEFSITRREFSTAVPETLTWPEPDVAVLKVPTFNVGYDRKNIDRLMQEASKAKFLIVDVRSNGGGAVLNLLHLSSYLFPSDAKLGTFINRGTVKQYVEEVKGSPTDLKAIAAWTPRKLGPMRLPTGATRFTGKMAVLVNGGTGSASEMLAWAMREIDGSKVIGTKSAGAVLASIIVPLEYNFNLQYPFQDYVTIKGQRLEKNPIVPDIEALTNRPGEQDIAVKRALAWYRESK